jgi:hypothetical protein
MIKVRVQDIPPPQQEIIIHLTMKEAWDLLETLYRLVATAGESGNTMKLGPHRDARTRYAAVHDLIDAMTVMYKI